MKKIATGVTTVAMLFSVMGSGMGVMNIANAALSAVGPVTDPVNDGFPAWFADENNLKLQLCLSQDARGLCLLTPAFDPLDPTLPNPATPIGTVASGNFPDESFYWIASADLSPNNVRLPGRNQDIRILWFAALEQAFLGGITPGSQSIFLRTQVDIAGLIPGETYNFSTPYGPMTIVADAVGGGRTRFEDITVCTVGFPCNFNVILPGTQTNVGAFLQWDNTLPAPPAGFIGDPNIPHTVSGGQGGANTLSVNGTSVGGVGINSVQTNLFSVSGQLFAPVIAEVTPVPANINSATPSYTFTTNDTGTITYGGDCTSTTTAAVLGNNTITLTAAAGAPLAEGLHNNCTVTVTNITGNASNILTIPPFTVDVTPPVITLGGTNPMKHPVNTPFIDPVTVTDNLDPAPVLTVGGTVNANVIGTYTLTYDATDVTGNNTVQLSRTVNVGTAPVLAQVTPIPNIINSLTPSFSFSATDSGTITYGGDCTSTTGTSALIGNNTVTFDPLLQGLHNACTVSVTNAAGFQSVPLPVNAFTVDTVVPATPIITNTGNLFTNSNTVTIVGTAEANSTVTVNGGATPVTGTADASGAFSIPVTLAATGSTFTAIATDIAGNTSTPSLPSGFSVVLDTVAPTAPVITTPNGAINTNTVTITGSGEVAVGVGNTTTVQVLSGTTVLASALVDSAGNFSIPNVPVTEGENILTTKTTDAAGNTSVVSSAVTIVKDTVLPVGTVDFKVGNITNQLATTIDLTSTKTGTFVISGPGIIGSVTGTILNSASTNVQLTPGDGQKEISVQFSDAIGNISTQADHIILDTVAPVTPVIANTGNLFTNSNTVTIVGTAEANSTVTVNGGATPVTGTADASGAFSIPTTLAATGSTFTAIATDIAGNTSTPSLPSGFSVVLDTVAPTAPVITTPNGAINTNTVTITGSGEVAVGVGNTTTVQVLSGTTVLASALVDSAGNFSIPNVPVMEGDNILTTKAIDAAGNTSAISSAVTISTDSVGPVISNVQIQNITRNSADISFGFTDAHFTLPLGTGLITAGTGGSLTNAGNGAMTINSTTDAQASFTALLPATTYGFNITMIDDVGNTSTATGSFTTATLSVALAGGNVTTTGTTTLTESGVTNGSSFSLNGTNIVIQSNQADPNSISGSLALSGVTDINVSGGTWNGVILPPTLINSTAIEAASNNELVSILDTMYGSGVALGSTVLETVKMGASNNGVSLTASGGMFLVNILVPNGTPGKTLSITRSSNGSIWEWNTPNISCTLDVGNVCTFQTDHLSFFAPIDVTDATPDTPVFTSLTNRELGATETSESRTLIGMNTGTLATVTNGLLSVDGGEFTSTGMVSSGSTVAIRLTNSSVNNTATVATLTINGVDIATFSSTTKVLVSSGSGGGGGGGGGGFYAPQLMTSTSNTSGNLTKINTNMINTTTKISSPVSSVQENIGILELEMKQAGDLNPKSLTTSSGYIVLKPNANATVSLSIGPSTTVSGNENWDGKILSPVEVPNSRVEKIGAILYRAGSVKSALDFNKNVDLTLAVPFASGSNVNIWTSVDGKGFKRLENQMVTNGKVVISTNHLSYFLLRPIASVVKVAATTSPMLSVSSIVRPNDSSTRFEFLSMTMQALGIDIDKSLEATSFTDVDTLMIPYVEKAKEFGIVGQNIEGRLVFRPNDSVSRAEALKILFNMAGISPSSEVINTDFTDVSAIWMIGYINKAQETGIASGQVINGRLVFRSNDPISRSESIKIISKAAELKNISTPSATVPLATNTKETQGTEQKTFRVDYLDSGLAPQTITIKKGDTVNFINRTGSLHWTASAVHPLHTEYPGSDIKKCGTSEQSQIFDACKGLARDEEFSFKFDHVGSWKFHDHLNPTMSEYSGTVIVE